MMLGSSLRYSYQFDISGKLPNKSFENFIESVSDDYFDDVFYNFVDSYTGNNNLLSVVADLSAVQAYLQSDIKKSEDEIKGILRFLVSRWKLHENPEIDLKLRNMFEGRIEIWEASDMAPNEVLMFEPLLDKGVDIDREVLLRFQFLEFYLLSIYYNRFINELPKEYSELLEVSNAAFRLIIDQHNLVKLRLRNDIVRYILRYYFENDALPIIVEQLSESKSEIHGNKKVEFDDETIKKEALKLIGQGKFIHNDKRYIGKANLEGIADNLLNKTFKEVETSISKRQLSRRLKKLLPKQYLI